MYFKKEPQRGYNAYIDTKVDDYGMLMDIGLLVLEPGDTYVIDELDKETAVLLFEGKVVLSWAGKTVRQLDVRNKYRINILAVKIGEELRPMPGADYQFTGSEHVLALASTEDARKLLKKI